MGLRGRYGKGKREVWRDEQAENDGEDCPLQAIVYLTKQMANTPQTGQAGALLVPRDVFIKAVRDELIDYFQGTSVQGLVELEADYIARFAHARLRDDLETRQTAT